MREVLRTDWSVIRRAREDGHIFKTGFFVNYLGWWECLNVASPEIQSDSIYRLLRSSISQAQD